MEALFLKIFNMSIATGWVILAVLFLRIILKKAPRAICCILWALVAVRLVCPAFLESKFSLIPSGETLPREILTMEELGIESGISGLDSRVNMLLADLLAPEDGAVSPMQIIVWAAARLWAAGAAAMLVYAAVAWSILRRRAGAALRMEGNIWICDAVKSPFILGFLSPRIYLPSDLAEPQLGCVMAHEKAHLKRHDHWWKPLGYLLLSVYWFQPLCWIAYILFCQDIELACDERVIRGMGDDEKKNYAEALLACSIPRHRVSACPVAFGETGVKKRIKSVLNYRKPTFWIIGMAAMACIAAAVCLLTNPVSSEQKAGNVNMDGPESQGDEEPHNHVLESGHDYELTGTEIIQHEDEWKPLDEAEMTDIPEVSVYENGVDATDPEIVEHGDAFEPLDPEVP